MGVRVRPGSGGRGAGESSDRGEEHPAGFDAVAQYGVGQRDPATGAYEAYDLPAGHPATQPEQETVRIEWETLLDNWPLIVAGFSASYGIRLLVTRMCWPEFWWHLTGLLADPDSLIARRLAPHDEAPHDEEVDGDGG